MTRNNRGAWFGEAHLKERYLKLVDGYYDIDRSMDRLINVTSATAKRCTYSFTSSKGDPALIEAQIGVPAELCVLMNSIHAQLCKRDAGNENTAREFAQAAALGADLSLVVYQFLHWVLTDSEHGLVALAQDTKMLLVSSAAIEHLANGMNVPPGGVCGERQAVDEGMYKFIASSPENTIARNSLSAACALYSAAPEAVLRAFAAKAVCSVANSVDELHTSGVTTNTRHLRAQKTKLLALMAACRCTPA